MFKAGPSPRWSFSQPLVFQPLNVQRFRGGLVFKAHRLVYTHLPSVGARVQASFFSQDINAQSIANLAWAAAALVRPQPLLLNLNQNPYLKACLHLPLFRL